jgi:multidrug efflux pump
MGYSSITAEFDSDMDMDEALQKVREKVDLAKPKLPSDAEDPVITEFNLPTGPIMQVNISGKYDLVRLKEVAEELQERLEQIPSILDVRLSGGLEREVRVDVDLAMLQFYGVAFSDVIECDPLGERDDPGRLHRGRHAGVPGSRRRRVPAIPTSSEDVVVMTKDGRPVYVRDVARVDFGFRIARASRAWMATRSSRSTSSSGPARTSSRRPTR